LIAFPFLIISVFQRQTEIDMPDSHFTAASNSHDEPEQNEEHGRDENNQSWRLNIEINPDVLDQARNISQDDINTLTNTIRQLYNQIGVVYFVSLSLIWSLYLYNF
jgi:hypothetical protein